MYLLRVISTIVAVGMAVSVLPSTSFLIGDDSSEVYTVQSKSKVSDELSKLITDSSSEYYPVVVWYDEVNNSKLEAYIEEKIGFNIDSIEVEYSKPSEDLISKISQAADGDPDKYLEILMKNHLELTAEERAHEKEKTEKYRTTKREILKELKMDRANSLIDTLKIPDNRIAFKSAYAPMIICRLSSEEIEYVSKNEIVSEITKYEPLEIQECLIDFGNTKSTMDIDEINSHINLTGDGVKIGIYETSTVSLQYASNFGLSPSQITIIGGDYNTGSTHSTYCAGIAAGSNGIAPDAKIYSSTCEYDWKSFNWGNLGDAQLSNFEQLIDNGVDLISVSWGSSNVESSCYNNWSKYVDYLISSTSTTIVCATGNSSSGYIMNPASSYNCIAVNGFIDQYDGISQNILNDYSYNNGDGCLKPDVVAPSLNNGTSTATPYIAGMIALMYQYKPSLAASPETTKAILIASCHKKCSQLLVGSNLTNIYETMWDGLTDRQGAGIPNMYSMISIISQHSYGNGVLNSTNNYERTIKFVQPTYNSSNINISMAYLQNVDITSSATNSIDDYDIEVTNNGVLQRSLKPRSSTELIYKSLTSDQEYSMRIYKYSGNSSEVCYAYAWSTDNEKYYNNYDNEGVYYLKNYKSSYYLSRNTTNDIAYQTSYSNSMDSLWILDCISTPGDMYNLKNANITSNGLGSGASINLTSYYAVDGNNASTSSINVIYDTKKGTYTFTRNVNGSIYALGIINNSTSSGSYAIWSPYSSNNSSQKWYLETANYRLGDINFDGVISGNDKQMLRQYILNAVSLNNMQKYLSDVNNDNVVNVIDEMLIN